MRIIAQNVETYALMRDHPAFALDMQEDSLPPSPSAGLAIDGVHGHDLRDSLWFFDGHDVKVWIDIQDVLRTASAELGRELPAPVKIPVDFYPLATLINKGIVFGVESELVQRRDTSFAYLRFGTRVRVSRILHCLLLTRMLLVDPPLPSRTPPPPPCAVQSPRCPASITPLPISSLLPPRPRDPPPRSP